MIVEFEKCGVVVKATADETGYATAVDVSVPASQFAINLWSEEDSGTPIWKMRNSHSNGISQSNAFAQLWDELPPFVRTEGGEEVPLFSAVAEIVDRRGRVTEPTSGMSATSLAVHKVLKCFEGNYSARELVELLRFDLAWRGYEVRPNIAFIRRVGECAAYHEVGAELFDRIAKARSVESVMEMTRQWTAFNDAVWGPK